MTEQKPSGLVGRENQLNAVLNVLWIAHFTPSYQMEMNEPLNYHCWSNHKKASQTNSKVERPTLSAAGTLSQDLDECK